MIIIYMLINSLARRVKYVIFQQVIFLFCQLSRLIRNSRLSQMTKYAQYR